ncbi:hypothetical protein AD998_15245 [bacterium 336/3]|nr:hypothetical protein AD998_15245 [bacterium 336/3]
MEKSIKVYVVVIIVIVLFAIFGFILITRDNKELANYINNAATLISLVLGLIAIFYSIVTNQQSSENFARLSDVVKKIEESAKSITSVPKNIDDKLENMKKEIIAAQKDKGNHRLSENSITQENNQSININDIDDTTPDQN